ncbi:MAG: response regulator transcription factor [Pseudomonadales bacterium]|nr:response regulator transcription factor [Pseudomonadales bacterium]
MPHILVVDDDELIQRLLENILVRAGYRVSSTADGRGLHDAFEAGDVDLVLLDIRLGRENGFDLAREITEHYDAPIIFVTGDQDVSDKVIGLELGADDYITKPFDQRELLARIRVVLRRRQDASSPAPSAGPRKMRFDGFLLDLDAHELQGPDGALVELTAMELQILACLAQRPRQALTRNDISQEVSGKPRERRDRTIDVVVSKLRRKLESASPMQVDPIQTVRGVGYKFISEVAAL